MQSRRNYPDDLGHPNQSFEIDGTRVHHVPIFVESRGNTLNNRGARDSSMQKNVNEQREHECYNEAKAQPHLKPQSSAFSQYRQSPPSFFPRSSGDTEEDPFSWVRPGSNPSEFSPNYTTHREPRTFTSDFHMGSSSPGRSQRFYDSEPPGSHQSYDDFPRGLDGRSNHFKATGPTNQTKNRFERDSKASSQSAPDIQAPKSTLIQVPSPLSELRDNVTIVPIKSKNTESSNDGPPKVIPLHSPEPTEPQSPPPSTTPIPLPPPPSLSYTTKLGPDTSDSDAIPLNTVPQKVETTREPLLDEAVLLAKPETPIPMPPPVSDSIQEKSSSDVAKLEHKQKDCDNDNSIQMVAIRKVESDVRELVDEINASINTALKDKHYRYLDEMLTRCMLRLDNIDCSSNERLRQARKTAIRSVSQAINLLESRK